MRVLVTGGAGFLGAPLCLALATRGNEVVAADDLSRGDAARLDDVELVRVDVRTAEIEQLIADFEPEAVVHLARASDDGLVDPVATSTLDVVGTTRVASAAARTGTKIFVTAASGAAIYGDSTELPLAETAAAHPLAPDGMARLQAELTLGLFARMSGGRAVALRTGSIYGPGEALHPGASVIAHLLNRAARGEPFELYGDGRQTRDFVFIDDAVQALLRALDAPAARGVINVSKGLETELNALAQVVVRVTSRITGTRYVAARPGRVRRSALDPTRAAEVLDWQATVKLEDGLERTWAASASR